MTESQFDKIFKEQLGRKLEILEEIREDAQAVGIDLPGVVVCGAQSAGKSSVLESITGINFPRGENLCTRCPAVVQMVVCSQQTVPTVKVSLQANFEDARESNLDGVSEMIRELSERTAGNGITDRPIYMKIIRNTGPVMTFIDLPGITHVNPEGLEGDVHEVTAGMVDSYVSNQQMINLVVIPATDDFGNAEGLKIAMRHDPQGVRTLGVISKIDNVPKDSDIVKKIKMQRDSDIKLAMGFVALKNRSPAEVEEKMSTEALYAAEERMHSTHPILKQIPKDKFGHSTLVDKIVGIQGRQVDKRFPEILRELRQKKMKAEQELAKLPKHCDSVGERRGLFTRCVNVFVQRLTFCIEGKDIEHKLASNVTATAAAFAMGFHDRDYIPDYFSDDFGRKLEKAISDSRGHTLDNFLSDTIFRNTLNEVYFDGHVASMATALIEEVYDFMLSVCCSLIEAAFRNTYPSLLQEVKSLINEFISEQKEKAIAYVMCTLNHERRVVFTQDKSYMKLIAKFRSGPEPVEYTKTEEGEDGMKRLEDEAKDELSDSKWSFSMLLLGKQRVASFLNNVRKAVMGCSGEAWARYEMQLAINSYAAVMANRLSDMIPLAVKSLMVYEPSEKMAEWLNIKFSDQRLEMSMQEEDSVRHTREILNNTVSRCCRAMHTVSRV